MPALGQRIRRSGTPTTGHRRQLLLATAVAATIVVIATLTSRYGLAELALYRDAVRSWFAGDGLYSYRSPDSHLGFPLPPAAALLLAPLAISPLPVAGWVLASAGLTALVLALIVLVGPVARRHARRRGWAVAAATMLALATEPVRRTLGLGHLDLIVFGLVVADVVALRRRLHHRRRAIWWPERAARRGRQPGWWAGVGTGLATAISAGPALFIGYLAVTRQWRAALTALGTAAGTATVAAVVAPRESVVWFTDVLWSIDRTGPIDATDNQSLAGVLARFYDASTTPVLLWLSFSLLLLAVGLIRARSAHAEGDEAAAFTLVGLTGLTVGPLIGMHSLVWVLPAVLIGVDVAARWHAASRLPGRRRLLAARRGLSATRFGISRRTPLNRYGGSGATPTHDLPGRVRSALTTSPAALALMVGGALVYLMLLVAPVWAYEHRLPESSHYADGIVGMLAENTVGFTLILLMTSLPWRPGASPAVHPQPWVPTTRRRPIPPARRPPP
ncbi:MAG TPA: glycosyltransferase 87 family protein [Actinoplanes sp.]|nr:glycosyltransferase 87 family protein [Actinoplanes sp.]